MAGVKTLCRCAKWSVRVHHRTGTMYLAAPLIWRKCPVWAVPSHAQLPVFSLLCAVTTKTITHGLDCLLSSQLRQRFYNTRRSTLFSIPDVTRLSSRETISKIIWNSRDAMVTGHLTSWLNNTASVTQVLCPSVPAPVYWVLVCWLAVSCTLSKS